MWTVQTMKFLIVKYSLLPILIPFGSIYSPRDHVFKYPLNTRRKVVWLIFGRVTVKINKGNNTSVKYLFGKHTILSHIYNWDKALPDTGNVIRWVRSGQSRYVVTPVHLLSHSNDLFPSFCITYTSYFPWRNEHITSRPLISCPHFRNTSY